MLGKNDDAKRDPRGKFNVIDLFITLAALALICLVIFAMSSLSFGTLAVNHKEIKLSYTLCISSVDVAYINKIEVGDTVLDATTKRPLGNVIAVENGRLHTVFRYDEKTGGCMQTVPDSYDLIITVLADSVFEDGVGYTVEDRRIAVGAEYTLLFPDFAGNAYCTSVSEAE